MQHKTLLLSLLGTLVITSGGVFFLVSQGEKDIIPPEYSLLAGVGIQENDTEPPSTLSGGGEEVKKEETPSPPAFVPPIQAAQEEEETKQEDVSVEIPFDEPQEDEQVTAGDEEETPKEEEIPEIEETSSSNDQENTSPSGGISNPEDSPAGSNPAEQEPQEETQTYLPVIISELQIEGETARDEFVELYNPNSSSVDLAGWSLKKKTSSGTESSLVSPSKFTGIILSFGYFLIAPQEGYFQGPATPSLYYSGKTYSFAKHNTVLLYDPNDEVKDKVGFGEAVDFEGSVAELAPQSQSIGRKLNGGTYIDTDNNTSDFEIQTPTPKKDNKKLPDQFSGPSPPSNGRGASDPDDGSNDEPAEEPAEKPIEDPVADPAPPVQGCTSGQVDVNSASKDDLMLIKHIGEVRADELILLRPFSSLDDLDRIKGIGPARVADIKAEGIACVSL